MALSYVRHLGDGKTRVFAFAFDYLHHSDIQVRVDGTVVPSILVTSSSIQLLQAPAVNAVVEIKRVTDVAQSVVDYSDGSTLTEADLDKQSDQLLFVAQEVRDALEDAITQDAVGDYDAKGGRLQNVGYPDADTDAATKKFVRDEVIAKLGDAAYSGDYARDAANAAADAHLWATSGQPVTDSRGREGKSAFAHAEDARRYVGNVIQNPLLTPDVFECDGVTASFTLSRNMGNIPGIGSAVLVTIDGVVQHLAVYQVLGDQLVFTTPPDNGATLQVLYVGALAVNAALAVDYAAAASVAREAAEEAAEEARTAVETINYDPSAVNVTGGSIANVALNATSISVNGTPLGSAAMTDSADYATAAQGTLADTAVQPNTSTTLDTVTVTTLLRSATGGLKLGAGTTGAEQFRVNGPGDGTNFVNVGGANAGGTPYLSVAGADTNIPFAVRAKGAAVLNLGDRLYVDQATSRVGIGTAAPTELLTVNGTAQVATLVGNGNLTLRTNSHTGVFYGIAGTPGAAGANFSISGNEAPFPGLAAFWADRGVGGFVQFGTQVNNAEGRPSLRVTGSDVQIAGVAGGEALRANWSAGVVNRVEVSGAPTGGAPQVASAGADADVPLYLVAKGAGRISFRTGGGAAPQFTVPHIEGAVNYTQATGAVSGGAPTLSTQGADSNIDLALTPKGTGRVRFGSYVATGGSIVGHIEVKDSTGTVRKLAVIS